ECYPIAKVGGLADVVGALPKYQKELGIESAVIMPFYDNAFFKKNTFKNIFEDEVELDDEIYEFSVKVLSKNNLGFNIFFIDVPNLLYKDYVYSYEDTKRFLAFQIAALDWLSSQDKKPDAIHVHDHHTGLIPFMMAQSFKYETLKRIPSIFTIHNAQYQGWFSHQFVRFIPPFDFSKVGLLDWEGQINSLAAAIKCAWKVTTVSPSYMEELTQKANGLESLLSYEKGKCQGILNGIDSNEWNTKTDDKLEKNYTVDTVEKGKKANKDFLCEKFNLDKNKPLFAFIGRLVGEKGADLFPNIFNEALQSKDISILLLGSGHKETEKQLNQIQNENYNHFIGYDEKLAHTIYAGADFLLMPSRVEPCGLNQMYSLRYGTVPIVSRVGGLKDTVADISLKGGFGITHDEVSVPSVINAINRAKKFYLEKRKFNKNRKQIMQIDHSWSKSAQDYLKLYKRLKTKL
ncbi:glycogen synthase, partial [Polaribacter sp.]|nr:glycogen synthase [Polaribacter sp.]